MMRTLATCALFLLIPIAAAAQADDGTAAASQPPTSQGPMIVERLHSGFLFAPEVKATMFDKKVSGLIGGSVGWVADETFFIGGGGYWMPERRRGGDRELAYGGAVLQWFVSTSDRFGFSAKALLGGGRATLPGTITQILPLPPQRDLDRLTPAQLAELLRSRTFTSAIRLRQDFVVAEPEVNARISLARHVRLTVGAGYRFAGTDWRGQRGQRGENGENGENGNTRRRLSGATASLGVQIGG
jgi:hypothetical protein